MRVSIRPSDPGHANFLGVGLHHVYLNGSRVIDCITADEGEGLIVRYARDEWGKYVLKPVVDNEGNEYSEIVLETVRGKVEIRNARLTEIARPAEAEAS